MWCTVILRRYFITDRKLCGGLLPLLDVIRKQIAAEVDYIQVREKDLPAREIFEFVVAAVATRGNSPTKILVNERADIAWCTGADGVHLPSAAPHETLPGLLVARSCHREAEVRDAHADLVTFSPVFESAGKGPPVGLEALRKACRTSIPVFALGGITWENARACIEAGAAGVAGIRLFLTD